jgi:protein TonB
MFEAALGRADGQRGSLGAGTVISLVTHALAIGVALGAPRALPDAPEEPPEVTFVMPPPPPPPPLGGGAVQKPRSPQSPRLAPRSNAVVLSQQPAPDKPPEEAADEAADEPDGDPYGAGDGHPDGVPWGAPGGVPGSTGTGQPRPRPPEPPARSYTTLHFGSGMERPVLLSGATPTYTREARAARVEGTVVVRCTITVEGTLRDCSVLKGLPHLDKAVLDTLASHRYRPPRYEGQPVNLKYVFSFRFKLE